MSRQIIFRKLEGSFPEMMAYGDNWQVECHVEGTDFPIGLAWVSELATGPFLRLVWVVDWWRKDGVGSEIIKACLARWPSLDRGPVITEAGKALRRSTNQKLYRESAMRKRIYIAGPITIGDLAANITQASCAFFTLLRAGFAPLCPHWSAYSGGPYERPNPERLPNGTTHDDWMGADLPWVAVSDAVLRLPGESKGADNEVRLAESLGIPIFTKIDEVKAHFISEPKAKAA